MLTTLDWIFLGLLLLSALLGLWRGFVLEVMSLGGWVVAGISAMYLSDYLSPHLVMTKLSDTPRYALAFAIIFIVTLIVWGILTNMVKNAIGAMGLGTLDRLLGALFGVIRGGMLLVLAALLISHTPIEQTDFWQTSHAPAWCTQIAQSLKPYAPSALARFIP